MQGFMQTKCIIRKLYGIEAYCILLHILLCELQFHDLLMMVIANEQAEKFVLKGALKAQLEVFFLHIFNTKIILFPTGLASLATPFNRWFIFICERWWAIIIESKSLGIEVEIVSFKKSIMSHQFSWLLLHIAPQKPPRACSCMVLYNNKICG